MIDIKRFEFIRQKHGGYASWAIWADAAVKPKSNMGDMSIFDLDSNPGLLQLLKSDVIMAGLNIASFERLLSEPFRNFHDPSPRANDFKIRYAFRDTKYYGAYMTEPDALNSARPDLCGGYRVSGIPTAIANQCFEWHSPPQYLRSEIIEV